MSELRGIDVNLIVVLDALLRERSIARAGEVIELSPPAVSGALAKLRKLLDDPLLVRAGRVFELTPRARALEPIVRDAMHEIGRTFDLRPLFDPATSDRRFHIWASDYALATMTSELFRVLKEEAPGTSVEFGSLGAIGPVELLRTDVVVASNGRGIPGKRQSLFSDSFVCIVRADHPRLVKGALTLEDLAELPFAQVTFDAPVRAVSDDALAAAGISPRVAMAVPGFLAVPFMVAGTDMFGLVPARVAELYAASLGLTVATTPLPHSTLVEVVYWHPSKTNDPALRWLVGILRKTAERVEFAGDAASA
ncbi:MAG: LysR family transcriptional regulator [Microbacteriaceae bacterium]|nr:LysR family transcriptional regulator [Microbacteriaceae bacterium]